MTHHVRKLGLLLVVLAAAAIAPAAAAASSTPLVPRSAAVADAPCAGPLAANTEITNVGPVRPSRVDVLANDCVGLATASRPLTITGVGQGAYGTVSTDGATVTYDPRGCATGDADGNDLFSYTITDGSTFKSGIAVVHVVRPATSPLTDLPQVGFVGSSTIGSTVPLRLTWCGVPASGSSVRSYRLEQSTNGGSTFPTAVTAATTATSSVRNAAPNASYAWRVRTTDSRGRIGGYAASLTSQVRVVQESSASIRFSSGWSTASSSKYSGGKERYTSKAGATATLTATNVRAVAIVASRGAGRGAFNVYVDGVKVTPSAITERAGASSWRRVLYVRGLTSGSGVSHTVQLRAVGNGRVDLDAMLTLSGKRDQAVTFTSVAPAARYHGPAYTVTTTSTSGLPVSLSVNPASWGVCSLSGGAVTFLKPGSCRIDASQSGDATWNARTSSQTFTVSPIPLTVTGITAADRPYDGTAVATLDTSHAALDTSSVVAGDVVALSTAGATGAFTPNGDAGSSKTVHVSGLGLTGAAATRYTITQPTTQATIGRRALTVTFTAQDRPYDGTTDAQVQGCSVATVLAGDVVTCDHGAATASFADAGAGAGKTVTGSGFALAGADAPNYVIDTVDTATADIARAFQSVAFTSSTPVGAEAGTTYTPSATATSGLPVTITVDPGATAVCHLTAGIVTADADGTCILSADQPGDANHEAAAQAQQSFGVGTGLLAQAISFDLPGVTATYGDAPVGIAGTATSGLAVGFGSLTQPVCTVAGANVTIVTAGTCTIRASQPGNGAWAAAPNVDRSFTVDQRAITVTAVSDTKPSDGTTGSDGVPTITSGTLAAGDTGTWTQAFDTAAVGTGKTLTPDGTVAHGATDVTASYDITFAPVTTGVIQPLAQTISFDLSAVAAAYGDGPVGISASATSGLTVAFASQTTGVCTVAGTNVAIVTAGTCTIRASQPGNATYLAAPADDQSFTVDQRAITVTAVTDTKVADGTTSSGGVPTITAGSLATGDTATWTQAFDTAAAGTGKTLTPAGTVARGVADVTSSYDITFVPDTTGVITPGSQPQTISFDLSGVTATYGNGPVGMSATATSGLAVGFASLTPGVCTVSGTDATLVIAGTCTIRASQPGNASFAAAPDVDQSFTVARRPITVTAVTDTKPADGTTASTAVPTITAGTLAAGDTATWTQTFNTATLGTGKTLTPAGTVARGVVNVTASYLITFVPVTSGVITPGAADVTTSTVAVNPGAINNDGVSTATVTVHLFDHFLNSLVASGGTVTVTADHGAVGAVTDNNNGTYTATYTSDTFKGKVTISAALNGTPIVGTGSVNQH